MIQQTLQFYVAYFYAGYVCFIETSMKANNQHHTWTYIFWIDKCNWNSYFETKFNIQLIIKFRNSATCWSVNTADFFSLCSFFFFSKMPEVRHIFLYQLFLWTSILIKYITLTTKYSLYIWDFEPHSQNSVLISSFCSELNSWMHCSATVTVTTHFLIRRYQINQEIKNTCNNLFLIKKHMSIIFSDFFRWCATPIITEKR